MKPMELLHRRRVRLAQFQRLGDEDASTWHSQQRKARRRLAAHRARLRKRARARLKAALRRTIAMGEP